MEIIRANNLTKKFRIPLKDPGLAGSIKHLFSKKYKDKTAVDNINLTISEGEAVAYIGPNGAGKSTTIKMLTGIIAPTSGEVIVDKLNPIKKREENAKKIGAVFGQRTQLWWDLPLTESFSLLRDIYEIPNSVYQHNMEQFNKILGLEEFIMQPARKISLGQRMRADLAAALLHNPKILYLDEPTIGLDIEVKERIRVFIKEVNKNGATVMLTTHDLGDIEDICKRIVIIDFGKVIYDGKLQEVKEKYARERTINIQLTNEPENKNLFHENLSDFQVSITSKKLKEVSISFDKSMVPARDIIKKVLEFAEVQDFQIDEPKIDTVIKKVYERTLEISKED